MTQTQVAHGEELIEQGRSERGHQLSYQLAIGLDQLREDLLIPSSWRGVEVDLGVGWSLSEALSLKKRRVAIVASGQVTVTCSGLFVAVPDDHPAAIGFHAEQK